MKKLLILLLVVTAFFACSDDKKINRSLHSKGGKWEIISYERYFWSPGGSNNQNTYWCSKCGTIEFKKDGSGTLTLSGADGSSAFKFTYTNTDNLLTLFIDDDGLVYDLTWNWEKDQMTLNQNLGQAGYINVMTCKKK
jgi:hypothetical protein